MVHVMKIVRFLVMILLCTNFFISLASERYTNIPVPPLYGISAGLVTTGRSFGIEKMFPFFDGKRQVIMLATTIIVVTVICYMYKHNTLSKMKDATLNEMYSYVERLQKKIDACIDQFPFPSKIKSYLKESISKSIAEHIANLGNSTTRYIRENKRYLISLGAIPTGMYFCYPITGGTVAMVGVGYGFIKSLKEEMAAFKEQADVNKKEIINTLTKEITNLSEQIKNVQQQIEELQNGLGGKIDGVGEHVEKLSTELGQITTQMLLLHQKIDVRDQKDAERDERATQLLEALEKSNKQFIEAKKEFILLVSNMMAESAGKTTEEFKNINEVLSKIDGKQITQAETLVDVQGKIGTLLDNNEENQRKYVILLDTIKSSNLSLEEIKTNSGKQDEALKNFQTILDKVQNTINENHTTILNSINTSVKQCSELSGRISTLELRVENDQKYNKEMFEKLSQQNGELKQQIGFLIERDKNKEQELKALRKDLCNEAAQLRKQNKEGNDVLRDEVKSGFEDIKNNINQQARMLPAAFIQSVESHMNNNAYGSDSGKYLDYQQEQELRAFEKKERKKLLQGPSKKDLKKKLLLSQTSKI